MNEAFDNRNVNCKCEHSSRRLEWLRSAFLHEATSIRIQVQIKFPRDSAAIFHAILRITRIPYDTSTGQTRCSSNVSCVHFAMTAFDLGLRFLESKPHAIHFRLDPQELDSQDEYDRVDIVNVRLDLKKKGHIFMFMLFLSTEFYSSDICNFILSYKIWDRNFHRLILDNCICNIWNNLREDIFLSEEWHI